jgi:hypothetical protein
MRKKLNILSSNQSRLSAEFGEVAKFGNVAEYSEVNLVKYGNVAKSDDVFCKNELFNATVNIFLQRSDHRKYCSDHFSEEEPSVDRMHLLYIAF